MACMNETCVALMLFLLNSVLQKLYNMTLEELWQINEFLQVIGLCGCLFQNDAVSLILATSTRKYIFLRCIQLKIYGYVINNLTAWTIINISMCFSSLGKCAHAYTYSVWNIHVFDDNLLWEAATPSPSLLDPVVEKSLPETSSTSSVSNNSYIYMERGPDEIIDDIHISLGSSPLEEPVMEDNLN